MIFFIFLFQGCHYYYLKEIILGGCKSIKRLPDLCAPNLEKLNICYCENLIEIHDSIGLLDKLECLVLSDCMKLQILPSTLKVNERFFLGNCIRLEKFPNVHPEMKCLKDFCVSDSNIREWPLSLRYLTESIFELRIYECENLGKLEEINNCFIISPFELLLRGGISIALDFFMKNDFFPALRYIFILDSNIVSIPESIFRLPRLKEIDIHKCEKLREIQISRLSQSIRRVIIKECPSLLPQSSSRLLNQVRSLSLIIKQ